MWVQVVGIGGIRRALRRKWPSRQCALFHISKPDGPEAIEVVDVPAPADDSKVLIDVKAAMAFPELLQTRGLYQVKPPPLFIPGAEGRVVVVGTRIVGSGGRGPGALPLLGGFAEQVVRHRRI